MNYYEHHIGDFAEATAHLTFVEDAAYSRMIRKYYATEKPLPADLRAVQRLVGARTKEEREAVEAVLQEFFELQDDGWHQSRCDAELGNYHAKQAGREGAKEGAKERQRRARERRKALFEALRGHGIVPEFTTTSAELEAMLSRVTNPDGNANVTTPVTRDDTANQTPDTRHQSPDTRQIPVETHTGLEDSRVSHAAAVCVALRAEGIAGVNPGHVGLLQLLDQGAEVQNFVAAARTARGKGKGFAYVLGIVKGQMQDAANLASAARSTAQHPPPSRADQRAATIDALTGRNRERTDHADPAASPAIDVEARVVG